MDISKIDKNLKVETTLEEKDIAFYDVRRAPFALYGLYNAQNETAFKRLPDEIGKNTNEGVASLYLNTAGGRVRFATDSRYVAIHAVAQANNLTVTDEDYLACLEELAELYETTPEDIEEMFGAEELRENVLQSKVTAYVCENATIIYK